MKERIVIDESNMVKSMKVCHYEEDKLFCLQKIEKVPETFNELKELCKKLEIEVNISEDKIEFPLNEDITFWKDGTIKDCCTDNIAVNRTISQMWNIIKGLL